MKTIKEGEDSFEEFIRTVIHEYLHFFFYEKQMRSAISLEEEEQIIEKIEQTIWEKYFL